MNIAHVVVWPTCRLQHEFMHTHVLSGSVKQWVRVGAGGLDVREEVQMYLIILLDSIRLLFAKLAHTRLN